MLLAAAHAVDALGGAFASVTGPAVGWVIGMIAGMAIGENKGIYKGMQSR